MACSISRYIPTNGDISVKFSDIVPQAVKTAEKPVLRGKNLTFVAQGATQNEPPAFNKKIYELS